MRVPAGPRWAWAERVSAQAGMGSGWPHCSGGPGTGIDRRRHVRDESRESRLKPSSAAVTRECSGQRDRDHCDDQRIFSGARSALAPRRGVVERLARGQAAAFEPLRDELKGQHDKILLGKAARAVGLCAWDARPAPSDPWGWKRPPHAAASGQRTIAGVLAGWPCPPWLRASPRITTVTSTAGLTIERTACTPAKPAVTAQSPRCSGADAVHFLRLFGMATV